MFSTNERTEISRISILSKIKRSSMIFWSMDIEICGSGLWASNTKVPSSGKVWDVSLLRKSTNLGWPTFLGQLVMKHWWSNWGCTNNWDLELGGTLQLYSLHFKSKYFPLYNLLNLRKQILSMLLNIAKSWT